MSKTDSKSPAAVSTPGNFIREIIAADLADKASLKHGGRVATRFPPEPNGYLHIGHAKAICVDFGLAREFGGTCNLRFDDTNPTAEEVEYVDSIKDDVRWLGFEWDNLHFASDYFEQLYQIAVGLIQKGKAYVDSLNEAEIRDYRGNFYKKGRPSPHRDRGVEERVLALAVDGPRHVVPAMLPTTGAPSLVCAVDDLVVGARVRSDACGSVTVLLRPELS